MSIARVPGMSKVIALLAAASVLATACASTGEMPTVRAGNEPQSEKAREAGRTAGAGGSQAPNGTGLGSGIRAP